MSTLYLYSTSDWRTAITDSQQTTPTYTTYKLAANLNFSSSDAPYLNSGTLDTDYLYIRAYNGVNQTFNGAGYTITLAAGTDTGTGGFQGLFRVVGNSMQTALVEEVSIYSLINSSTAYILAGSFGGSTSNSSTGNFNPAYALFQNLITYTSNTPTAGTSVILGGSAGNITFQNWAAQSSVALTQNTSSYVRVTSGPLVLQDCYFLLLYFVSSSMSNSIGVFSMTGLTGTSTIENVYVYFSTTSTNPGNLSVFRTMTTSSTATVNITNMYVVISTYSTVATSNLAFIGSVGTGCTVNSYEVYTNNTSLAVNSVTGTVNLLNAVWTSYTWSEITAETTTPYIQPATYVSQYNSTTAVVEFSFSATASANGYNGNNIPAPFGVVGWCVDNAPLYVVTNAPHTNPANLEPQDIFGEHPESGQVHHHSVYPSVYNWVLDYTPRLLGFYADGYPIVSPFLVYDTNTSSYRVITNTDLNINNGLKATVTFNFISPSDGNTYYFQYDFCYVQTYCYPFTIGSFYGTPSTITSS
jgi:hypothetical protein